MTMRIPTAAQDAACNAVVDRLDGASPGTITIYSGAQPASANDAATGTVLATFTLPNPAFGNSASGTATLNTVASVTASATGTAGWFRAANSAGAGVFDGTVGTSGAQLNLNSTSITSGGSVQITSGSVTMPAS